MSPRDFDALLVRLSPERDEAARRYEAMRQKLIQLFAWRGCEEPEELADVTLDRMAVKLGAGVEIAAADPYRYACGIAFRVYQEVVRRNQRRRRQQADYEIVENLRAASDAQSDERLRCLRHCLEVLPEADRALILRYHEGEKSVRIRNRNRLAEELEIGINALRIRAHRIRQRLERCTIQCLRGESAGKAQE